MKRIGNLYFHFSASRDKSESEKAVTPVIIFINTNHENFGDDREPGFMILIGWWDYAIRFAVVKPKNIQTALDRAKEK